MARNVANDVGLVYARSGPSDFVVLAMAITGSYPETRPIGRISRMVVDLTLMGTETVESLDRPAAERKLIKETPGPFRGTIAAAAPVSTARPPRRATRRTAMKLFTYYSHCTAASTARAHSR